MKYTCLGVGGSVVYDLIVIRVDRVQRGNYLFPDLLFVANAINDFRLMLRLFTRPQL